MGGWGETKIGGGSLGAGVRIFNFFADVISERPFIHESCPLRCNPPSHGEEAYLTKRFQPVHQQEELVGVMLLRSNRTNRSS